MNILFITFHGFGEANGISKKIHYQINALKESGHHVDLCYYAVNHQDGHRKRMINNSILKDYGNNWLSKIKKRICYRSVIKFAGQNQIDFVYIRSDHNANPFTINLVTKLKEHGIKVVMEIPTYPYDQEYKEAGYREKFSLFIDKCYRYKLAKHLNAIVTFSNHDYIFNKRTIKISNGIDFSDINIKESSIVNENKINFIGVADVHYWHGYDRMIQGIGEYYQTPHTTDVYFHIVGCLGVEQELFMRIIQKYKIEKYIIFYGPKHGKELDYLFNICQVGIGSLARHRSNISNIKTLKNREYAARGIPFIYSETDEDFDNMPYILKIPANETAINILFVLNFYNKNKFIPYEIRDSIAHLSWKKQMNKVIQSV